jgi:CubicO group peptidase (beta-lactamase class C family)
MREGGTNQTVGPYPGETWLQYVSPEDAGYSSRRLKEVQDRFRQMGSSALLVIHDGVVLLAEGQVNRRFECRSIRKSFLSALYGIHVSKGVLDLNKTLADLGIDDEPPLTEGEKEARVSDLLKSRSGVYHLAAYEDPKEKPPRGSSKPGARWYYNNWDFNTLLTIFEQETGTCIFEEFKQQIADPLQMEEFRLRDTHYHFERDRSIHPAYLFRTSAKDMARFGLLYLRQGRWEDREIIPQSWITESTTSYSEEGEDGYGYMWWVFDAHLPELYRRYYELGAYEASGTGGQKITILPRANLVVVHLRNTYRSIGFDVKQFLTLLEMILDARVGTPIANSHLIPFQDPPGWFETVALETSALDRYVGDYEFENGVTMAVKREGDTLLLENLPVWPTDPPTRLLPISETKFILEDVGHTVTFDLDGSDYHVAIEATPDHRSYGKRVRSKRAR